MILEFLSFPAFLFGLFSSAVPVPNVTDLDFVERVVSYGGLLLMGWFFWNREANRTEKTLTELKQENENLKAEIKVLEKDIRYLLQHHTNKQQRHQLEDKYNGDDNHA